MCRHDRKGRYENSASSVRGARADHPRRRGGADGVSHRHPVGGGYKLERADYLLVYLVAAAELAVAVLSFGAARLTDRRALGLIVTTLVVLHLASGILDLVYMGLTGFNGTMIALTVLRFTVVVVFLVAWRLSRVHHTPGTSR